MKNKRTQLKELSESQLTELKKKIIQYLIMQKKTIKDCSQEYNLSDGILQRMLAKYNSIDLVDENEIKPKTVASDYEKMEIKIKDLEIETRDIKTRLVFLEERIDLVLKEKKLNNKKTKNIIQSRNLEKNNETIGILNKLTNLETKLTNLENLIQLLNESQKLKEEQLKEEQPIQLTYLIDLNSTKNLKRSYYFNLKIATLFHTFESTVPYTQKDLLNQALFEFVQKYASSQFMKENYYNNK